MPFSPSACSPLIISWRGSPPHLFLDLVQVLRHRGHGRRSPDAAAPGCASCVPLCATGASEAVLYDRSDAARLRCSVIFKQLTKVTFENAVVVQFLLVQPSSVDLPSFCTSLTIKLLFLSFKKKHGTFESLYNSKAALQVANCRCGHRILERPK